MKFQRVHIADCAAAPGAVIVIDVLRAFSTAAYAFAGGVSAILLTDRVDEALALRQRFPEALLMGEVEGLPIPGFDFGNSPGDLQLSDLTGRRLIQRTTRGTLGVVQSVAADWLFASSFVCAAATARRVAQTGAQQVTFVITGSDPELDLSPYPRPVQPAGARGDEDLACADYLEALLGGKSPAPTSYLQRVLDSPAAEKFKDPTRPDFPVEDLARCTALDRFDFAMQVWRENGLLRMERA